MIPAAGRADAGAFLARLLRLDPAALVRLRPVGAGVVELWARLPFDVLVVRRIAAAPESDVTVAAAELLTTLSDELPVGAGSLRRRDEAWRWGLPARRTAVVERIPAAEVVAVASAASRTLRTAVSEGVGGRRVGERVLRDALLDHVAIVATSADGTRVEIPQRMVQALVRMGFVLSIDDLVTQGESFITVRSGAGWLGLDGSYGSAWYKPISTLRFG